MNEIKNQFLELIEKALNNKIKYIEKRLEKKNNLDYGEINDYIHNLFEKINSSIKTNIQVNNSSIIIQVEID